MSVNSESNALELLENLEEMCEEVRVMSKWLQGICNKKLCLQRVTIIAIIFHTVTQHIKLSENKKRKHLQKWQRNNFMNKINKKVGNNERKLSQYHTYKHIMFCSRKFFHHKS